MNSDLKWLAENVHEWPFGHNHTIVKSKYDDGFFYNYLGADNSFTRAQWQAARDELSGKTSWDDAPEWAQWLAQDEDGRWFWYAGDKPDCKEPFFEASTPVCDDQDHQIAGHGRVLGDWRNTLERRPENHSVEPTEKVWRGPEDGLPPVGVKCTANYYLFGDKSCDCEIVAYHSSEVWVKTDCGDNRILNIRETDFRPIRTEEEKAVEEMANEYNKLTDQLTDGWTEHDVANHFIRVLGYRKQESE